MLLFFTECDRGNPGSFSAQNIQIRWKRIQARVSWRLICMYCGIPAGYLSVMLVGKALHGIKILRTKGEYSVVFLQLPIVIFCKHCSNTLLLFQDLPWLPKTY